MTFSFEDSLLKKYHYSYSAFGDSYARPTSLKHSFWLVDLASPNSQILQKLIPVGQTHLKKLLIFQDAQNAIKANAFSHTAQIPTGVLPSPGRLSFAGARPFSSPAALHSLTVFFLPRRTGIPPLFVSCCASLSSVLPYAIPPIVIFCARNVGRHLTQNGRRHIRAPQSSAVYS